MIKGVSFQLNCSLNTYELKYIAFISHKQITKQLSYKKNANVVHCDI